MKTFPIVGSSEEQGRDNLLPLPFYHTVDGFLGVLQNLIGRKRGAVSTREDETPWEATPGFFCEIDRLRNIRKIVEAKADRLGSSAIHNPPIIVFR